MSFLLNVSTYIYSDCSCFLFWIAYKHINFHGIVWWWIIVHALWWWNIAYMFWWWISHPFWKVQKVMSVEVPWVSHCHISSSSISCGLLDQCLFLQGFEMHWLQCCAYFYQIHRNMTGCATTVEHIMITVIT